MLPLLLLYSRAQAPASPVEPLLREAAAHVKARELTRAIPLYRRAIALSPDHASVDQLRISMWEMQTALQQRPSDYPGADFTVGALHAPKQSKTHRVVRIDPSEEGKEGLAPQQAAAIFIHVALLAGWERPSRPSYRQAAAGRPAQLAGLRSPPSSARQGKSLCFQTAS